MIKKMNEYYLQIKNLMQRDLREKREIAIITGFIMLIILCLLFDIYEVEILRIPLGNNEYFNIIMELFGIQAAISTLGIALLALLTESIKEIRYGVRVGHFVMMNHHKFLTHQSIIVFEMLFLFVNYIFLTFKLFNASVALFIVSLSLIIFLVSDILKLFTDKERIYMDIKSHILKQLSCEDRNEIMNSLNRLNDHLSELAFEHKILELSNNIEIYFGLYENSTNENKELIEKYFGEMFNRLSYYSETNVNEVLYKTMLNMYKLANKEKETVNFVNTNIIQIYDVLSSLPQKYYYKENDFPYISLYNEIRENEIQALDNKKQTVTYVKGLYNSVFKKIDWEEYFGEIRMTAFYSHLYSKIGNLDDRNNGLEEINAYTRSLIHSNEKTVFSESFFKKMDELKYQNETDIEVDTHFLTILAYFYYILYEPDDSDKIASLKPLIIQLLKDNAFYINEFIYSLKINLHTFPKIIKAINNQLGNWEYFFIPSNSGKVLVSEEAIISFFVNVFISKSLNFNQLNEYIEYSEVDINRLYYLTIATPKKFKSIYNLFIKEFYDNTYYDDEEALRMLGDSLNHLIINKKIDEAKKIDSNVIIRTAKSNIEKIEEELKVKLNHFFGDKSGFKNKIISKQTKSRILPLTILNDALIKPKISEFIEYHIISELFIEFEEKINKLSIDAREENKIDLIFEYCNEITEKYDLLIGTKDSMLFYKDPKRRKYDDLIDNLESNFEIRINGNEKIFLSSENLNIQIDNITLESHLLTEEEIFSYKGVEKKGDGYTFDDHYNNCQLYFEKNELLTLFSKKYRKVILTFDLLFFFNDDFDAFYFKIESHNGK